MKPALDHHYANNRHHPEFQRINEIWLPITDFDRYLVSSYGNIKSKETDKRMAQFLTPKGYCRLQIVRNDGEEKNKLVHSLVAGAFIANPENKPQINHKNCIKTDNRVDNLEWATRSENIQHAYSNGLIEHSIKYVVYCETLDITTFGIERMVKQLKENGYHNANSGAIWNCLNGASATHLGLIFSSYNFEPWMNSPINDMNLVDVMEMFCDWAASCKRHDDGNLRKSIEHNAGRFEMSPQLTRILENTMEILEP